MSQALLLVPTDEDVSSIDRLFNEVVQRKRFSFRAANLQDADLSNLDLRDVDFTGANLNNTNLSNCDLRGVTFIDCDLRDANLRGARINGCTSFKNSVFSEGLFDGVELK